MFIFIFILLVVVLIFFPVLFYALAVGFGCLIIIWLFIKLGDWIVTEVSDFRKRRHRASFAPSN